MGASAVQAGEIGADATISRAGDWLSADTGDGAVMMSPTAAEYIGLSETGGRIWALLATPCTLAELCAALAAEYEISAEEVRADVQAFVASLSERGALAVG
jgi:coenzyme PQQ synthesis protein D (PqqD)